jgi:aspartyl-tRNA(Asn)/glutamyl-tRNA(Gln) amidotransferase subunit A
MDGIIPLSSSLDHAGPLSRCVTDAALLFETIARPATQNSGFKPIAPQIRKGVKSFRIGLPRQFFFDRIQGDVRKSVLEAAAVFEELGAEIHEVNLKGMNRTNSIAAEITGDEALAFHSKWLDRRFKDYGRDVRARLAQSRGTTAVAYIQARQEMNAYRRRLIHAMDGIHLLMAPTLPIAAPSIEEADAGMDRSGKDIRTALLTLTRPANLSGMPSISIPCGFSTKGLPIGLQLIGHLSDEVTVLRAAYAYEKATPWHKMFPSEEIQD